MSAGGLLPGVTQYTLLPRSAWKLVASVRPNTSGSPSAICCLSCSSEVGSTYCHALMRNLVARVCIATSGPGLHLSGV